MSIHLPEGAELPSDSPIDPHIRLEGTGVELEFIRLACREKLAIEALRSNQIALDSAMIDKNSRNPLRRLRGIAQFSVLEIRVEGAQRDVERFRQVSGIDFTNFLSIINGAEAELDIFPKTSLPEELGTLE